MQIRLLLLALLFPALISCGKENETIIEHEGHDRELLTPEVRAKGIVTRSMGWNEPTYTPAEEAYILQLYKFVDPNHEVPANLLKKTLLYYHRNKDLIPQKKFTLVVDFTPHSRKYRLYMLNMVMGTVGLMHTSHGSGSDPADDGFAHTFSNIPDSHQSSLGFYLTGETYEGRNGYSLRIDGLSESNSMVRDRAIVIHGAGSMSENMVKQGRSDGCIMLAWENRKYLIDRVKDGTLMYVGLSRE